MAQATQQQPDKSLLERKLPAHVDLVHKEMSSSRFAEDRVWLESGLFYQLKQWLDYDDTSKRYTQIKQSKKQPRPMPVSNYFAKTINANANALGSDLVRMTVIPTDDSHESSRAAEYTEMAKDAIDEETQMRIHNPLLAKHTVLWGLGCMKDTVDLESDTQEVSDMEDEQHMMVGCYDCGNTTTVDAHDAMTSLPDDGTIRCPDCTSTNTTAYPLHQAVAQASQLVGKGKIKSEVVPIFQMYLPRDCQNANLAPELVHVYPMNLHKAQSKWSEFADEMKAHEPGDSAINAYAELQTLLGKRTTDEELILIKEWWAKWERLPEKIQSLIEDEVGEDADTLMKMVTNGVKIMTDGVNLLEFSDNPNVDPDTNEPFFPFTFFLWEVDPANVYVKGLSEDLKPLQKRLNRCDSLIERAMMANGAGKWLVPTTQQGKPPTGDPNDIYEYDVVGDNKIKPEFVSPQPFSPSVWQLRNTILEDFETLGYLPPVMQGQESGDQAFRTVAYIGAKAAEMINTQRFLWESSHRLRYKKLFALAKIAWDEPRKIRVAGHNGKLMYMTVTGEQMRGQYETDFVKDSSRARSLEEKMQAFETAAKAGFVNPLDPSTRTFAAEMFGLTGLIFSDELQYRKAERDLEKCKQGQMPMDSPYQKWDVFLKTFSDFTLTEDFEDMAPEIQVLIMGQCEHYNQMMMIVQQQQEMQAMASAGGMAAANGMGKPAPGGKQPLSKVPGQDISPEGSQYAAVAEGNSFAGAMQ